MPTTVGLIGWPVEHSRSPAMHNAAFVALGLDWRYILLPTPLDQLADVVARIRSGELGGANVTIPHKQAVMPFLNEIDPAAQAVGAVNTIVKQAERLIGFNTDTLGFKRALIETGIVVQDQPCAVLGAGGSARAVVYVLRELGAQITVYARDTAKAHVMLRSLAVQSLPVECHSAQRAPAASQRTRREARSAEESLSLMDSTVDGLRDSSLPAQRVAQNDTLSQVVSLTQLNAISSDTRLIVNTTPVGLSPSVDASPWPDAVPLPSGALIFDLLNNPARTKFMQQAERADLRAVNGWNMLVYQGAAAFEKWTGIEPPVDVMKRALEESMKEE
jgi:shikimate dehydrogenase